MIISFQEYIASFLQKYYFNLSSEIENPFWMAKYCLFNVLFSECFCITKAFHHYAPWFLYLNKKREEKNFDALSCCDGICFLKSLHCLIGLYYLNAWFKFIWWIEVRRGGGVPILTVIQPALWSLLLPMLLLICVANLQVWSFIASAWNRSRMRVVIFIVWKTKMYLW